LMVTFGVRLNQGQHIGLKPRMRLDSGDDSRLGCRIAIEREHEIGDRCEVESRYAAAKAARPQRFLHVDEA